MSCSAKKILVWCTRFHRWNTGVNEASFDNVSSFISHSFASLHRQFFGRYSTLSKYNKIICLPFSIDLLHFLRKYKQFISCEAFLMENDFLNQHLIKPVTNTFFIRKRQKYVGRWNIVRIGGHKSMAPKKFMEMHNFTREKKIFDIKSKRRKRKRKASKRRMCVWVWKFLLFENNWFAIRLTDRNAINHKFTEVNLFVSIRNVMASSWPTKQTKLFALAYCEERFKCFIRW